MTKEQNVILFWYAFCIASIAGVGLHSWSVFCFACAVLAYTQKMVNSIMSGNKSIEHSELLEAPVPLKRIRKERPNGSNTAT